MTRSDHHLRALSYLSRISGLLRLSNWLRFGRNAPAPAMRLNIPPELLQERYHAAANGNLRLPHWRTGQIKDGDWDIAQRPFVLSFKFKACKKHFIGRLSWEETNIIDYGMKRIADQRKYDDCFTRADLVARYARLDDLWKKTKRNGALPDALNKTARLHDCIVVHMDRDGKLIFGNQGFHRLSIAKLARVKTITVLLGVTHKQAVQSGAAADTIATYRSN